MTGLNDSNPTARACDPCVCVSLTAGFNDTVIRRVSVDHSPLSSPSVSNSEEVGGHRRQSVFLSGHQTKFEPLMAEIAAALLHE